MTAARLKTYDMFKKLWVLQWKLSQAAKRNRQKKFGILYDKVWWTETLEEAWKKVRANRGAGGVDDETIEYIEKEYGVERFLKEIQTELAEKRYRPEKVKRVWIDKPGRKEKRPLGIPTVKDRVIQMAVKFIIEPILEVDFRECSYGFRPGRSAHQAIDKVSKYLACGCQWVIDLDIKSCFDSIPHEELITLLRERITDKWIIRLIRRWLKAGILDGSRVYYTSIGTCQGAVLSPLLANLYLNQLDRMWEERGYANRYKEDAQLIRYADDRAPRGCTGDEGRPLEAGLQEQASNHLKLHWLRAIVVSVKEKARQRLCQVSIKEARKGDPLLTCRKRSNDVKTGWESLTQDKSKSNLFTAWMASGMKVART